MDDDDLNDGWKNGGLRSDNQSGGDLMNDGYSWYHHYSPFLSQTDPETS